MTASRETIYLSDFTGGLNLTTSQQNILPNETPDCLNVDFGARGGITIRGGFQTQEYNTELNGARFLGVTYFSDDVLLIQSATGDLLEWDGSTLTDTTADVTDNNDERVRMAPFKSRAYFANGRLSSVITMRYWDGTNLQTLTNNWSNDYTAPTSGNMPKARHIASHNGHMWVADTVESSVRYPYRVRFSHLQQPEAWAEADYFDIDPSDDGDPITGLVPFREMLLIFKKSGVYAVYGYDRDTFTLERITNASGTCTCGAIAVNSGVAYWFATDGMLMAFDGRGVTALGQPIRWWSDIGKIKHGGAHRLMWSDDRLWLALEAGSSQPVSFWLFVWDPIVKAFTRYDKQVTDLIDFVKLGADADPLFLFDNDPNLYRFDRDYEVDASDPDGLGSDTARIDGYYRTGWITAGETATRKRWKRPRVTAAADATTTIRLRVFHDFDELTPTRQQEFTISAPSATSLWGVMNWGDNWFVDADEYYEFSRMPSSGTAYAIQYEFSSPDNPARWWVDSVAVPFRRKAVK